jgi:hypothetical protein
LNINEVATIWAEEYDACVKRGKDFINFESVQTGNLELMKTLFRVALLKGLTTPPGVDFSLVNEFGNGVKAYWVGAQMRPFPIPLIPAPGSIQNIAVNSNVVINVGTWPLYPPLKPARKQEMMVNMFILAAVIHLFSIGGIIQTTSLYPSAPSPIPAPGVISWTGYLIPPVIPIPNILFPSPNGSEPPVIEQPDGTDGTLSDIGPTQEYESPQKQQEDILGGNISLDNVIDTTLPRDVLDPIQSEEIIKDFKEQLEMGGTKCE